MTAAETDLLVLGSVVTPDTLQGGAYAGHVAIVGDRIVGVGSRAEGAALAGSARRVVDLGPGTVTAGLVDAHIHPIAGFEMSRGVDLSGLRSTEAVRAALAAEVAARPDGWVHGWGLDPGAFEGGPWSNAILDGIADHRLVHLTLFDAHGSLVSNPVLERAGITGRETFPDNGRVGVGADGVPTGVLFENSAQELARRVVPEPSRAERVDALERLLAGMAACGLTGGQMLDLARPESLEILEALETRGDLPLRLRVSPWVQPGSDLSVLESLAALQGRHGRRWEVRGIKLIVDGTIDNGTAWLFEPDSHGESTRSLWLEPEEYARAVSFFDAYGIPTTTHAIGDRAVSFVARTIRDRTRRRVVHRIEHIETIPDEVLGEIVASGAATSMQPTHAAQFVLADGSDNWSRRLGPERAARAWRIRDLRDAGVTVALGSDWPVAGYDPRGVIAAARLRRPAGAPEIAPVRPEQAISAARALEGMTSQYWRSVGEPGGEIVVGGRADLTAFDGDPLTADPDAFARSEVLLTVVGGEPVVGSGR